MCRASADRGCCRRRRSGGAIMPKSKGWRGRRLALRERPLDGHISASTGTVRAVAPLRGLGLRLGALLGDLALEPDGRIGKLRHIRLGEEVVEAAAMLDRAQSRRAYPKAHRTLQRIGNQRGLNQIGQEASARLAVGMADFVAGLNGLARQLAAA